jgi:hypothetical protein
MSAISAKVTAIEKRGVQYQAVVEIVPKYHGSFSTLVFAEFKPHSVVALTSAADQEYAGSTDRIPPEVVFFF